MFCACLRKGHFTKSKCGFINEDTKTEKNTFCAFIRSCVLQETEQHAVKDVGHVGLGDLTHMKQRRTAVEVHILGKCVSCNAGSY